jgi:hypothetical protein
VKNSYTERHRNGKGSRPRPSVYTQQYKDNYEEIFRKKKENNKEEELKETNSNNTQNI